MEGSRCSSLLLLLELCTIAGIKELEKAKNLSSPKIKTALCTGSDCLVDYLSVGEPNTSFNNYSNGPFVRGPLLERRSQRVVLTTLSACLQHLPHFSLLSGHTGEYLIYKFMRKESFWPRVASNM